MRGNNALLLAETCCAKQCSSHKTTEVELECTTSPIASEWKCDYAKYNQSDWIGDQYRFQTFAEQFKVNLHVLATAASRANFSRTSKCMDKDDISA